MGPALALLGAALGAWLWLPVSALQNRVPVNLAAVSSLLGGILTGLYLRLGLRWGRPCARAWAPALAVPAAFLGRYWAFVENTAYFRVASGEKLPPALWDARTARYFLESRFSPGAPWELAFSIVYLALAGYAAWKAAGERP